MRMTQSQRKAFLAAQTVEQTSYPIGAAVIIDPQAPVARLGVAGTPARGVIEAVVSDTPAHPTRGPLYHIRLTTPGARGWLDTGYARNYADELTADPALPDLFASDRLAWDGEPLGTLIFDIRADWAGHRGLWVYPASYGDGTRGDGGEAFRLCQRRARHLSESFGVPFYVVPFTTDYLRDGRSPGVNMPGWYAATLVDHTAALRAKVGRGYDVARALTPRPSGSDDGADGSAESEAQAR